MRIYRLDKPHPTLIADGRMSVLPVRNPREPVSGYALQIDTMPHLVELSFDELDRIADCVRGERRHQAKGGAV
jgi:hypothetical protein